MLKAFAQKMRSYPPKKWIWLVSAVLLFGGWVFYLFTTDNGPVEYSGFKPVNVFTGPPASALVLPTALAVGPTQKLYILDSGNKQITVLNPDGRYAFSFGGPGSGRAELDKPESIEIDAKGKVYVVDQGKARVVIFASDGTYLSTLTEQNTKAFQVWKDRHAKSADHASKLSGSKWVANMQGITYQQTTGQTLVSDGYDNKIVVFSKWGNYKGEFGGTGTELNQFQGPAGMAWDKAGRLYVADKNNNRIVVYAE